MWSQWTPCREEPIVTKPPSAEKKYCQLYWPGHNVHWIHARHWWSDKSVPATGIIVHNGWVHFTAEGVLYSRWTHNASEITAMLTKHPRAKVIFSKRWRILAIEYDRSGNGLKPFYLDVEPSDCKYEFLSDIEPDA